MEQNIIKRILACNNGKYCNLNNIEKNYLKEKYKELFKLTLNTSCGSCLMNAIYKVAPLLNKPIEVKKEEPKNDLTDKSNKELKMICKTLGLPTYGSKKVLIKRIENT